MTDAEDRRRERNNRYKRENKVTISVRLNKKYDAKYLEILEYVPNKTQFLRDALDAYAKENNIKTEDQ